MSKARLVITAVVKEGRTQTEVAAEYGVSQGWVSRLVARYRDEGEAAFTPRSRRPKTSPRRLDQAVIELIITLRHSLIEQGTDAGPDTIAWHLAQHHHITVAPSTISRHLSAAGLVTPQPKKRPKSSYLRFEAAMPNETWQADFTHYRLTTGQDVEVLSWLDDATRYALRVTCHVRVTAPIVLAQFRASYDTHGIPSSTLTDNGMVFTVRFAGGKGGITSFEAEQRRLHITQKNSRPGHPTTCGKVERFHQTLKQWLTRQPQAATIDELQAQLDTFVEIYNHQRPHRSLPNRATPATIYTARPKATPTPGPDGHHHRVRVDRVDTTGKVTLRHNGRLHHIGIGRTHARTHVLLLVDDLDIRVIDAATGELLRALELDPTRDYQPTGLPRSRKRTTPRP